MAQQKILLLCLPRPVSVNAAYVNRREGPSAPKLANGKPKWGRKKSVAYLEWQAHAKQALLGQRRPEKPINVPMEMVLNLPLGSKLADASNFEKVTADFLKKAQVILDDSLIRRNTQQWVAGLKYAVVELYAYDGPTVSEDVIRHIQQPWEGLA